MNVNIANRGHLSGEPKHNGTNKLFMRQSTRDEGKPKKLIVDDDANEHQSTSTEGMNERGFQQTA